MELLDELVKVGDTLARAFGSMEDASLQIQELNFRTMESVRKPIEQHRHVYPVIAQQVIDSATVRVIPYYSGNESPLPRESGLPYDRSKSLHILKKFWKLIREV